DLRQVLTDPGDESVGGRLALAPLAQALVRALDQRVEKAEDDVRLGREVLEEGARGDLGRIGDLRGRRRLVALLDEEPRRNGHDRLAGAPLLALAKSELR